MSPVRTESLNDLKKNSKCEVILVTPANLSTYIINDQPLHPSYEFLSETHKADYLRTYFMHFHGGGYSDIKRCSGDWNPAFDYMRDNKNMLINSYHESGPDGVAGDAATKALWKEIPGNCAYIIRADTDFTREWYTTMIGLLEKKLESLKAHPATNPQSTPENTPGYPIQWTEMLGDIFHPLSAKFRDRIAFTVPPPVIYKHYSEYR
jgi:hypothetical protein